VPVTIFLFFLFLGSFWCGGESEGVGEGEGEDGSGSG